MAEHQNASRLKLSWTAISTRDSISAQLKAQKKISASDRLDKAWLIGVIPLFFILVVPVVMLVARTTPRQLIENLHQTVVVQAIGISLRTTFTSLFAIVILGTPVAYLMAHKQFRFKRILDTLIDLPTVLPPSVAGIALLITFGRKGVIGGWLESAGIQVAFTQLAVILAQVFIAAPFFVRAASLGFANVDDEIMQAAQLDGANRRQVFRFIVLPLSQYALLSGSMLSWARALGEFGATMIFAGNLPGHTQTMPTAIYLGFEVDLNLALTLAVILLGISFFSMLSVKFIADRNLK